jgi:hypothetical protein
MTPVFWALPCSRSMPPDQGGFRILENKKQGCRSTNRNTRPAQGSQQNWRESWQTQRQKIRHQQCEGR